MVGVGERLKVLIFYEVAVPIFDEIENNFVWLYAKTLINVS